MQVNLQRNFTTYDGKDTHECIAQVVAGILYHYGSDKPATPEDKYRAYQLSRQIIETDGCITISTEDASFIKAACAAVLTAGAYGQIHDLIEQS